MSFSSIILVFLVVIFVAVLVAEVISIIVDVVSVSLRFIDEHFFAIFFVILILAGTMFFFGDEVDKLIDYVAGPETESGSDNPPGTGDGGEKTPPNAAAEHDLCYTDANGDKNYYDVYIDDVTWQEASKKAVALDGYLAVFNTEEEFMSITSQLAKHEYPENQNYKNLKFYIGGRRNSAKGSREYRWVGSSETASNGEALNSNKYDWLWMKDEPSYHDGTIIEDVMDVFYHEASGQWVCNDVADDIIGQYKQIGLLDYSGQIGYIVEYPVG